MQPRGGVPKLTGLVSEGARSAHRRLLNRDVLLVVAAAPLPTIFGRGLLERSTLETDLTVVGFLEGNRSLRPIHRNEHGKTVVQPLIRHVAIQRRALVPTTETRSRRYGRIQARREEHHQKRNSFHTAFLFLLARGPQNDISAES